MRKILKVLAQAIHRIYNIPIKQTGNDFQDVKLFEEKLDIEIQIYYLESREIYRGSENQIKIYILMSDNHDDVITNLEAFACKNPYGNTSRDNKCKLCGDRTKGDIEKPEVSCMKCHKYFYGQLCFDKHMANKKCIEHSYLVFFIPSVFVPFFFVSFSFSLPSKL